MDDFFFQSGRSNLKIETGAICTALHMLFFYFFRTSTPSILIDDDEESYIDDDSFTDFEDKESIPESQEVSLDLYENSKENFLVDDNKSCVEKSPSDCLKLLLAPTALSFDAVVDNCVKAINEENAAVLEDNAILRENTTLENDATMEISDSTIHDLDFSPDGRTSGDKIAAINKESATLEDNVILKNISIESDTLENDVTVEPFDNFDNIDATTVDDCERNLEKQQHEDFSIEDFLHSEYMFNSSSTTSMSSAEILCDRFVDGVDDDDKDDEFFLIETGDSFEFEEEEISVAHSQQSMKMETMDTPLDGDSELESGGNIKELDQNKDRHGKHLKKTTSNEDLNPLTLLGDLPLIGDLPALQNGSLVTGFGFEDIIS